MNTTPAAETATETDAATDRAAVADLIGALALAWNAGDADAYGAPFTEDATYVNFLGQVATGRAEIVATHRWLFERMPGSRMPRDATPPHVRFLTADTAVVVEQAPGTTVSGSAPDPERASAVSFVAVRTGDGWRLAHFQNTRVQAPPAG